MCEIHHCKVFALFSSFPCECFLSLPGIQFYEISYEIPVLMIQLLIQQCSYFVLMRNECYIPGQQDLNPNAAGHHYRNLAGGKKLKL